MTTPTENPNATFIQKLAGTIVDRVLRGQCNYESDTLQLDKYLAQARKLNEPTLERTLLNMRAIVSAVSGHLDDSALSFLQLYHEFETNHDIAGMMRSLNNQATSLVVGLRLADASVVYEQTEALIAPVPLETQVTYTVYGTYKTSYMAFMLYQKNYAQVEQLNHELESVSKILVERDRQDYSRISMYSHQNMGELRLAQGRLEDAQSHTNLAKPLAEGLGATPELASIWFTLAHIELAQDRTSEAETCWEQGENLLKSLPIPFSIGSQLITEALYLKQHSYPEKAQDFATRARIYFDMNTDNDGAKLLARYEEF